MTLRGRVLLGAHVVGPAAVWVLRRVEDEEMEALRFYRRAGRLDVADSIERAVAELREAARSWRETEAASADGSAEAASAEAGPPSKGDDLLVTVVRAADRLGVSPSRVRQLLRLGVLRGRRDGGIWLVERLSVDEHLALRELIA